MSNTNVTGEDVMKYIEELRTTDISIDDYWFSIQCEFSISKSEAIEFVEQWKDETCYYDKQGCD